MPVSPTYPGVYIEEVPSGVRTLVGVATSITAFIGRAERGPVNEPTTINNFGDFERRFGGLRVDSMMSYAVRDFYRNGGSQAIIVRVVNSGEDNSADAASAAKLRIPIDTSSPPTSPPGDDEICLEASSPGAWGNNLQAYVEHGDAIPGSPPTYEVASPYFNLRVMEVVDDETVTDERFLNVSLDEDDARYLPRVLKQESLLVTAEGNWGTPAPQPDISDPASPLEPGDSALVTVQTADEGSDGAVPTGNDYVGSAGDKTGIHALDKADLFNLLCIPPPERGADTAPSTYQEALTYCKNHRAFLVVDAPREWGANAATAASNAKSGILGGTLGISGTAARNAAVYFPHVVEADPLRENQLETFVPCGIVAGVMARTDANRGVWKAPAGLDAALNGTQGLQVNLTDNENGMLNPLGLNCLRSFPVHGRVAWGARTMRGADQSADEYKYVPVRRLALFLEESLYRGTQWVVFEPNDEPLWAQIRLNVGAFMQNLFRQGAFQGSTPKEAYLVKCDAETTTAYDQNRGVVNILVGFAPLKPAEFVIIKIQQLAGQTES